MSPPKKKVKKTNKPWLKPSLTSELYSISSLPDDLVFLCLARISRLYYPTLSLLSKRFRSLIASPDLYKVRSLLGLTESCLYIRLRFPRESNPRWFTLSLRPDTTNQKTKKKKEKKSSEYLLVPIPSYEADRGDVVAVGSSIYSIGRSGDHLPSSNVSVLDCMSHTWHQDPNMKESMSFAEANVIDGKIYVVASRPKKDDNNSSNWIQVFDPKTKTWNYVSSSPNREFFGSGDIYSTEICGKISLSGGGKYVSYNPIDGTCEPLGFNMYMGCVEHSHCVIDNVIFYYYCGLVFHWSDTKKRNLKGLRGLPKIVEHDSVKLANYGGKMAVFWNQDMSSSGSDECKEIWCAVISIERRNSGEEEIWGTVEWFGVVLKVPKACESLHVLAATL